MSYPVYLSPALFHNPSIWFIFKPCNCVPPSLDQPSGWFSVHINYLRTRNAHQDSAPPTPISSALKSRGNFCARGGFWFRAHYLIRTQRLDYNRSLWFDTLTNADQRGGPAHNTSGSGKERYHRTSDTACMYCSAVRLNLCLVSYLMMIYLAYCARDCNGRFKVRIDSHNPAHRQNTIQKFWLSVPSLVRR